MGGYISFTEKHTREPECDLPPAWKRRMFTSLCCVGVTCTSIYSMFEKRWRMRDAPSRRPTAETFTWRHSEYLSHVSSHSHAVRRWPSSLERINTNCRYYEAVIRSELVVMFCKEATVCRISCIFICRRLSSTDTNHTALYASRPTCHSHERSIRYGWKSTSVGPGASNRYMAWRIMFHRLVGFNSKLISECLNNDSYPVKKKWPDKWTDLDASFL